MMNYRKVVMGVAGYSFVTLVFIGLALAVSGSIVYETAAKVSEPAKIFVNPYLQKGEMAYVGKLNGFDYNVGPVVNLEKTLGVRPNSGMDPIALDYVFKVLHTELEKPIVVGSARFDNYFQTLQGELNPIDVIEKEIKTKYFGFNYYVDVDPATGAWNIQAQAGSSGDPQQLVDDIKRMATNLTKPDAWPVFGPLLARANELEQACLDAEQNESICQVPEVVLGLVYFGLFDPPERVAFKYYQGDNMVLPAFCPNKEDEGFQCKASVASAIPQVRGIHPREKIFMFYQAQQFIETNESDPNGNFHDLCHGGDPAIYQDCVSNSTNSGFNNLQYSPTGNAGVWKPLPGANTTVVMRDTSIIPNYLIFTNDSDATRVTTLNGQARYI